MTKRIKDTYQIMNKIKRGKKVVLSNRIKTINTTGKQKNKQKNRGGI